MPNPPPPPLGPDGKPIGPEALLAIFPEALVQQEVSAERWIEIPDEVREILTLWAAGANVSRPSPGEGAGHAGEDLLQERGGQPGRFAQAEYRDSAGLLQQGCRHQDARDRNRRGPVGLLACTGGGNCSA